MCFFKFRLHVFEEQVEACLSSSLSSPASYVGQQSSCDKSQPIYSRITFFSKFDFNVLFFTLFYLLFPSKNPTQPTGESMKWEQDWKMVVRLEHLPQNRLPSAHTVVASHRNSTEGSERLQLRNHHFFRGGSCQRFGCSCSQGGGLTCWQKSKVSHWALPK